MNDQSDNLSDAEIPQFEETSPSRRSFLQGAAMASGAAALIQPTDVFAMMKDDDKKVVQAVSEHARPTVHPKDVHALPRWRPTQTGPYNLSRPLDNHFGFAKVQANLGGDYSWLAQYGWICMAPPGKPAYPLLARIQLAQIFVTPADPKLVGEVGPHDYMLWGTFTTTHADPRTMEPVDRIINPYTGKMIDVPTLHYADKLAFRIGKSILVPGVDPTFYTQPWDRDGGFSQHFFDVGDKISYTVLGSSQQDGPHQPRCDLGFWTANKSEIMNPRMTGANTQRDYSATMKASEYAWYGVPKGDEAQLLIHLTGLKTENVAKLPSPVKNAILTKNKDRFVI